MEATQKFGQHYSQGIGSQSQVELLSQVLFTWVKKWLKWPIYGKNVTVFCVACSQIYL